MPPAWQSQRPRTTKTSGSNNHCFGQSDIPIARRDVNLTPPGAVHCHDSGCLKLQIGVRIGHTCLTLNKGSVAFIREQTDEHLSATFRIIFVIRPRKVAIGTLVCFATVAAPVGIGSTLDGSDHMRSFGLQHSVINGNRGDKTEHAEDDVGGVHDVSQDSSPQCPNLGWMERNACKQSVVFGTARTATPSPLAVAAAGGRWTSRLLLW